jgi:hypothetical protein
VYWKVIEALLTDVASNFATFPLLSTTPTTALGATPLMGADEARLAKLCNRDCVKAAYAVAPERAGLAYAFAFPCGVSVLPLHNRSPPEAAAAPVSRFKDCPADTVTVPVKSANAAIGKTTKATAKRQNKFVILNPPE